MDAASQRKERETVLPYFPFEYWRRCPYMSQDNMEE
jgi:hypothetical protein